MAIVKVRVQVDGVWTNLTLEQWKMGWNDHSPATTSYNLANKYYPIKLRSPICRNCSDERCYRCHSGRSIETDRKRNDEACDHAGISIKRRICDK